MKKRVFVVIMISLLLFASCGGDSGISDNRIYPEKTNMKTDGQLYSGGEVAFPDYLWQTPESERYDALDRGSAKGYFIKSLDDTWVFCYVGFPKNASAQNKVPGVVLIHGGGGTAFFEWVNFWTSRGYAAIAMDTEGMMPVENSYMNTSNRRVSIKKHGPSNNGFNDSYLPVEQQWAYHAIAAVIVSNSFLRSFDCVDVFKIGITGISYGSFLTWQAVARYVFAAPVYGSPEQKAGDTLWKNIMKGRTAELWDDISILENNSTPFLYYNSNVDWAFSVLSTTESRKMTKYSCMVLKHNFLHGHDLGGLQVKEIYAFADNICLGEKGLIQIEEQPTAESLRMRIRVPSGVKVRQVTGFYTADSMLNENTFWQAYEGDYEDGWCTISIPGNARYYYINVKDDRNLEVSSDVIKIK